MTDGSLEARIAEEIAARADVLGMDTARLRVTYVLNRGGFTNRSYHVTDGHRRFHLKLADQPETLAALERWRGLHALLAARHHAPPMVDWVRIPGAGLEGPLFDHIDGAVPDVRSPALVAAIGPLLGRLHGDRDLAARLAGREPPAPCRDTLRGTLIARFREELEQVGAHRPGFVSARTLEWVRREVDAIEREAWDLPAFAEMADSPIHGDLWLNNLLRGTDGRWWVLDWDDLSLGDPALDWATLLGPTVADPAPLDVSALPPDSVTPAVRERLPLYARAVLLDWVLDPIADWIEADAAPEHAAAVRAEKERIHHAALARYRAKY